MKKRFALFLLGVGSLVAVSVSAENLTLSQQPVCEPVTCEAPVATVPYDTVCPNVVPCATTVPCTTPVPCDTICPATPAPVAVTPGCC